METSEKGSNFSENTNPIDNEDNLHIVGFKVKLDGDEAYTFALDKEKSISADILTILADCNKTCNSHVVQRCPSNGEIRHFFKMPNVEEQTECHTEIMNTGVQFEEESSFSVLQLKLTSTCTENKEIEVHIKSKSDDKDPPENEDLCLYDIKDQPARASNTNPQSSCLTKSPQKSALVQMKHITEMSTSGTQTGHETVSTSMQTACVEVRQQRGIQENITQTDRTSSVSTATEEKILQSAGIQTDVIPANQVQIQTEEETAARSSQTETAAIYSIDREYDKSTQTVQNEDVGTSTDFDIYIVDKKNVVEKSVDTEDLPFAPLVVAKKAEKGTDEMLGRKSCDCTCGHRNHDRCIYKCCFHKEYPITTPRSLTHCPYHQCFTFSSGFPQCGYYHCPPTSNCDNTSTCDENFRFDVHKLYCCKCKNLNSRSNSEPSKEKVEKPKAVRNIPIGKVNFVTCNTPAVQEKIYKHSRFEIGKSLGKGLRKFFTIMADRASELKVEKAESFKIPVVIEQSLISFVFSSYRSLRVVVNPVSIALSADKNKVSEKDPKQRQPNVKLPKDENLKIKTENFLLMFLDGKKENSIILSPRPVALADDKHSRVCLCNKCYLKIHGVVQGKQFCEKASGRSSTDEESKQTSADKKRSTSTSPKIQHKSFNYTSKDMWKPYDKSDDVLHKKIEETDIIYVGETSSDGCFESAKLGLKDACEVVNDHLLSLRLVDETTVRKAAEILHRQWFESAGGKYSDLREVRNYIQYFLEYSNNLLKTLLHSVDDNGNNVLHFAFANNRYDLAEEFLNNGLSTDLLKPNKNGNSPLMICSVSQPKSDSDWSVVRRTFEMGDVNAMSDKNGQTPLMNGASCGFQAMVDLLLEVGANPSLQDQDGSTALMYAAEHGHEKCIKSIVKHRKCDPTTRDKDGQTACSIALNNGHKNIAVLIHMQELENRRLSKNSYSSKRYIWTGNQTLSNSRRKEGLFVIPRLSASSDSL